MRRIVVVIVGLYAALMLASFSLAGDEGQTLVMSKCSSCHNLGRICANLGGKDKSAWASTVARMASKGAALDAAQQTKAVDYLSATKPDAAPFCQ